MQCPVNWKLVALLIVIVAMGANSSAAVDTVFVIDEQASSLTIKATTELGFTLMDTDTQSLGGTIDATFDFGTSGSFPSLADMTVTSAAISPLDAFSLTLGSPPNFGVNVTVNDTVANVQTPNPPVPLNLLPTALVRYSMDASGFDIILDQGTMVATGAVSQTIDLADSPVIGAADPGTLGELTFLNINTVGPITQVDALFELPIMFTEDVDVDGQIVTLDVEGQIFANASFNITLSGLPVDLDDDGDVDGADFLLIQQTNPSLIPAWRFEYGAGVGANSANLQTVPEPSALVSTLIVACGCVAGSYRYRFF